MHDLIFNKIVSRWRAVKEYRSLSKQIDRVPYLHNADKLFISVHPEDWNFSVDPIDYSNITLEELEGLDKDLELTLKNPKKFYEEYKYNVPFLISLYKPFHCYKMTKTIPQGYYCLQGYNDYITKLRFYFTHEPKEEEFKQFMRHCRIYCGIGCINLKIKQQHRAEWDEQQSRFFAETDDDFFLPVGVLSAYVSCHVDCGSALVDFIVESSVRFSSGIAQNAWREIGFVLSYFKSNGELYYIIDGSLYANLDHCNQSSLNNLSIAHQKNIIKQKEHLKERQNNIEKNLQSELNDHTYSSLFASS